MNPNDWNKYQTLWNILKNNGDLNRLRQSGHTVNNIHELFSIILAQLYHAGVNCSSVNFIQAWMESMWVRSQRPFYRVYPSVFQSFQSLNLDNVPLHSIRIPHGVISVEFHKSTGIQPILFGSHLVDLCGVPAIAYVYHHDNSKDGMAGYSPTEGEFRPNTFGDLVNKMCTGRHDLKIALSVACAISLMAENPDIISPIISMKDLPDFKLAKDKAQFHRECNATKTNGIGYEVGKNIESVPHIRRPHPALYWVGHKPNLEPVIKFRKGAVIKKRKITRIPTGYRISGEG